MAPSQNSIFGSPHSRFPTFSILCIFEPDIIDFVKNLWREMTPSQNWIFTVRARPFTGKQAQAEHEQARANFGEFSDFGRLESDITDFVKNLWRELTHSKIWILGSENGSSTAIHGQAWASRGWARASTSKFWNFPILGVSSQISPICEEFKKENDTFQK